MRSRAARGTAHKGALTNLRMENGEHRFFAANLGKAQKVSPERDASSEQHCNPCRNLLNIGLSVHGAMHAFGVLNHIGPVDVLLALFQGCPPQPMSATAFVALFMLAAALAATTILRPTERLRCVVRSIASVSRDRCRGLMRAASCRVLSN